MNVYIHEDRSDDAYERQLQAELDAETEGARVGNLYGAAGLNPYPVGTPEALAWERGRLNAVGQLLSRAA